MSKVKRLLVVKLSALGDLFHAVPVVHQLSEHYGCKVDWVTQPEYVELLKCHQDVDRVISFPRKGGLADIRTFLRTLRVRRYDLALDLQGLTKSGLVMGLCRSKRKIGSSHPREAANLFVRETPPVTGATPHAMDVLFDTLRYLKVDTGQVSYPLTFKLNPELPKEEGLVVALAPRSRWISKDWPECRFMELGKRLVQENKCALWILGGAEDAEIGDRLQGELGQACTNLCGKHPLLALGPILKRVNCLVSNDSGPMHFAAAVGTPLVALFGPTDPAKTGPYGSGHLVIRSQPGEMGYPDHRSYKKADNRFISSISVEDVFNAVNQQLGIEP